MRTAKTPEPVEGQTDKSRQIAEIIVRSNALAVKNKVTTADKPLFTTIDELTRILGPKLKTGIPYLDFLLGGGLPPGTSSKWWGPEAAGKTTAALCCAGETLKDKKADRYVLWVQGEEGDPRHALPMFNIDPKDERFIFYRAQGSGEQAFENILEFLLDGRTPRDLLDLVVIDSLAAFEPVAYLEAAHQKAKGSKDEVGEEGTTQPARVAAMYAKIFRRLHATKALGHAHMIMISQARCGLDPYAPKEISVGGKATDHAARFVFKIMKESGGSIVSAKDKNKMIGHSLKTVITKDGYRHRLQGSTFFADVFYGRGFDQRAQYFDILIDTEGLIETSAGRWNLNPLILAKMPTDDLRNKYEKFHGKPSVKKGLADVDLFIPVKAFVENWLQTNDTFIGQYTADADFVEDSEQEPEDALQDLIREHTGVEQE